MVHLRERAYRADRSLSDLKGYDPQIHHGTPEGILRAIASAFGAKNRALQHADLLKPTKVLVITGERLAIGYLQRPSEAMRKLRPSRAAVVAAELAKYLSATSIAYPLAWV